MATWSKFLAKECKHLQKYQIGDFVFIYDGSKSIKSNATLKVKIVGHEFSQRYNNGKEEVCNAYDIEYENGYIHTNYPEHCIISKVLIN